MREVEWQDKYKPPQPELQIKTESNRAKKSGVFSAKWVGCGWEVTNGEPLAETWKR